MTLRDESVVPPLAADDPVAKAVDDAVLGDPLADSPETRCHQALSADQFASFYIRHRSAIEQHARRFLDDRHDIEDVVQETFLRLFLAIEEIDTELQAIAFARRVLTNLCIDRYRAARRRPKVIDLDAGVVEDLLVDDEPSDPIVRAEDAATVRHALSLLSPLHRAALVKREVEEKSLPLIAIELDLPQEAVKHVLFRARRSLRRLLAGSGVEPGGVAGPPLLERMARTGGHAFGVVLLVAASVGVVVDHAAHRSAWSDEYPAAPSVSAPSDVAGPRQVTEGLTQGRHTPSPGRDKHLAATTPAAGNPAQPTRPMSTPHAPLPSSGAGVGHRQAPKHTASPPSPGGSDHGGAPHRVPESPYLVTLNGQDVPAAVNDQSRSVSGSTTVSTSSLSSADDQTDFSITQSLLWAPSGATVSSATVNVSLPTTQGQQSFVLDTDQVSTFSDATGLTNVILQGAADATDSVSARSVPIDVALVLDPDHLQLRGESVRIAGAPVVDTQSDGDATPSSQHASLDAQSVDPRVQSLTMVR